MFVNKKLILKNLGLSIKYKLCNYTKNKVQIPNADCQRSITKENKLENGFLNVCVRRGVYNYMYLYFWKVD